MYHLNYKNRSFFARLGQTLCLIFMLPVQVRSPLHHNVRDENLIKSICQTEQIIKLIITRFSQGPSFPLSMSQVSFRTEYFEKNRKICSLK